MKLGRRPSGPGWPDMVDAAAYLKEEHGAELSITVSIPLTRTGRVVVRGVATRPGVQSATEEYARAERVYVAGGSPNVYRVLWGICYDLGYSFLVGSYHTRPRTP